MPFKSKSNVPDYKVLKTHLDIWQNTCLNLKITAEERYRAIKKYLKENDGKMTDHDANKCFMFIRKL